VVSLSFGGVQIAIPAALTTDANGQFTLTGDVPVVDSGTQPISVVTGASTHTISLTVQDDPAAPTPTPAALDPYPVAYPLTVKGGPLGDNLLRVFRFDNVDKQWTFYDPDPDFAPFISLSELVTGKAYWIEVKREQRKTINGKYMVLYSGWNLVAW
jgi:hypothetical protein